MACGCGKKKTAEQRAQERAERVAAREQAAAAKAESAEQSGWIRQRRRNR